MATYNETLTKLRDAVSSIRSVMNRIGLIGSNPMDTWGNQIEQAISDKDVEISNLNSEISNKDAEISDLNSEISDKDVEISNLNSEISDNSNNFDNIYDAIVEKGQSPDKDNRSTYAPAILKISSGGGIPSDLEISDAGYLFAYGRIGLLDYFKDNCINATSWYDAFYNSYMENDATYKIKSLNRTVEIDNPVFNDFKSNGGSNRIEYYSNCFKYAFKYLGRDGNYNGKIDILLDNQTYEPVDTTNINTLSYIFDYSACVNSIEFNIDYSKIIYTNYAFRYMNRYSSWKTAPDLNKFIKSIDWENMEQVKYMFQNTYLAPFDENIEIHLTSKCNLCEYLFEGFKNENIHNIHIILDNVNCSAKHLLGYLNCGDPGTITEWNNGENDIYVDKKGTHSSDGEYFFADNHYTKKIKSDSPLEFSYINYAFQNCYILEEIPVINKYDYGSYQDAMEYAFQNCYALKEIIINETNKSNIKTYKRYVFQNCNTLKTIHGDIYLAYMSTYDNMFSGCTSLETIDTTTSFGGLNTDSSMTLDLSASAVFNISDFLTKLASNNSGKTRILKLNSTVYDSLDENTLNLAAEKNYTLSS